ncbi:helix-turn-helix transcriptional regulator [Dactylosporangium sp. NPDC049742]|uniref:helix-turn-helix transcriptional regulator n=1 Tax=Dactylosporangium sp. NPDC049742 TaxID=3154737 RepID=UPI00342F1EC4
MVSASTVQKVLLRGRDADRAAVAALLTAAAAGHGGALVVAGPTGIGRTALLADAPDDAAVALTVTGCPAEAALPYAGLHRLLAGCPPSHRPPLDGRPAHPAPREGCRPAPASGLALASASRLGSEPGSGRGDAGRQGGAVQDQLAAGMATLAALRALAAKARGPVLCRIDDAQWLDKPSLDALAVAARRAGGDRIAFLFALRDTPACPAAEASLAGLPVLRPAPLDLRDSRDLLTAALPDLAGDVAGVLAGMASGNPRALTELAAALTAEQRRGQAAPPATLPRDSPLRREYRTVLRALPAPTRRALLLAATAALTGPQDPTAGAPTCPVAPLLAAGHHPADLTPAEDADLIHIDADLIRFAPPLFAQVLYAEAALADRHTAHHRLAALTPAPPSAPTPSGPPPAPTPSIPPPAATPTASTSAAASPAATPPAPPPAAAPPAPSPAATPTASTSAAAPPAATSAATPVLTSTASPSDSTSAAPPAASTAAPQPVAGPAAPQAAAMSAAPPSAATYAAPLSDSLSAAAPPVAVAVVAPVLTPTEATADCTSAVAPSDSMPGDCAAAEVLGGLTAALHRAAVADGFDDALASTLAAAAEGVPPALAATALRHAAVLTSGAVLAAERTLAAAGLAWRGGEPHQARMLLRSVFGPGVPEHLHAERELLLGEIDLRTGASGGEQHTLIAAAGRLIARDRQRSLGALILAGEALLATGRHDQFGALAERALRLRRPGDPVGAVLLFEHLTGLAAIFAGEPARAGEPMRRVLHLAAAVDDPPTLVRAAGAGILIGEDQQAYRLAVRAARLAGGAGDRVTVPHALDLAATAAFALGDLDLAVATATEGQRLAAATGQDTVADNCRGMLAVVLGMLGDGPASQAWARRCRARAGVDVDSQARAMCVWAAALLDVAEGRYADAAGRLWGVMCTAGGRGHLGVQIPATPTLIEAVARCGDRAPAREILRAYDVWASSTANPTWLALSARCHALLADTDDEADDRFRAAIRLHLAGDSPFARARTELLYGEELRRRRHPAAARAHLRRALATFEQFGAVPWAQRTAAELRAAGDHVAAAAPEDTRAALTAQQARIAELVAGGATNREVAEVLFLSPRTVDHHLRNIFTRLGVRSRTELAKVVS